MQLSWGQYSHQVKGRDDFSFVSTCEAKSRLLCVVLDSSAQEDIGKLERVQPSSTKVVRGLENTMDSEKLRAVFAYERRARLSALL